VAAAKEGVSHEEWKKFLAYVAGFYSALGNYHFFGKSKFIPDLTPQVFEKILRSNPLYGSENDLYREVIDELYHQIQEEIFDIGKPFTSLGFPDEGGVTAYFSRNMTKDDL